MCVVAKLASGTLSLSVAALLRPHLAEANHLALLSAVSNETLREAREVLAAWFPQPDVLPSMRKLPVRGGPPSPVRRSGPAPAAPPPIDALPFHGRAPVPARRRIEGRIGASNRVSPGRACGPSRCARAP